ncbi:hypothetical protein NC796_17025 [Aliifodinibius sp. S!AR15-10]|uniref:hypothetical protein n=1 Tax=Aliifodinibius sp. S!AR15-10 TaxID=2950437 RepID=UPI002857D135|nr:hypothetical protein [Aliifodinibius sp. S!AR15-10]MDR8392862.1 hypothetical protein [Aliifodinibius sp. S!AR15-10]
MGKSNIKSTDWSPKHALRSFNEGVGGHYSNSLTTGADGEAVLLTWLSHKYFSRQGR